MSDGARILVVDDTPLNVKLLADLLTRQGLRRGHRGLGPGGARSDRRRSAGPGAPGRDDARDERLRGLRANPRESRDGAAAGGDGDLAGRGARSG